MQIKKKLNNTVLSWLDSTKYQLGKRKWPKIYHNMNNPHLKHQLDSLDNFQLPLRLQKVAPAELLPEVVELFNEN